MKRILSILSAFVLAIVMLVGRVFAQVEPYTLFGTSGYIETDYDQDIAVQMSSGSDSYGGIDFSLPDKATFADITHLSTDFMMIEGACGGGSPRFQISVIDPRTNTEKTIFAYIGKGPTFSCEPTGWQMSGNLVEGGMFIDATQLGGLFYTPYQEALKNFDNYQVTSLELTVDSGWMFGSQSLVVDNIRINDEVFTFTNSVNY